MQNNLHNTLRNLLRNNIVSFTYRKVNGEIRHAKGTRNLDLARQHTGIHIPTPTGCEQPTSYYDVEALGWRSYKVENLISIDGFTPIGGGETRKGELPKREIPVQKSAEDMHEHYHDDPIDLGGIGGLLGMPIGVVSKGGDKLPIEDLLRGIFGVGGVGVLGTEPIGVLGVAPMSADNLIARAEQAKQNLQDAINLINDLVSYIK